MTWLRRLFALGGLLLVPSALLAQAPETPQHPQEPPEPPASAATETPSDEPGLRGRWRLLFQGGVTHITVIDTGTGSEVFGASGGMQVSNWIRDDVALDLRIHAIDVGVVSTRHSSTSGADLGFLVGARYYPPLAGGLRPHLGGSIGAFSQTGTFTSGRVSTTGIGGTRLGGTLEGGLDFRIGSWFLLNVDGIYTLRDDRASRFDVAIGLGFIFGSGH